MRSTRFLVLPFILVAGALEGCSVAPRDTRAVYEPVTDITATATPMAQLSPSAGEVVSVLESKSAGILTQRIVLKGDPRTPGENGVTIKVDQGSRGIADINGNGVVAKPTETMIENELSESFGDVDMKMSLTWNRNSFGPFGYAIGHVGQGVTCIYAWQYSAGRAPRLVDSPGAFASGASMPIAPTSVRARLCKSGLGEAEIVAILRDMTIYPPGSSAPYVDPAFENVGASSTKGDALSSAGVPGGYFLAPKSSGARADVAAEPAPRRGHVARHRRHVAGRERPRHARVIRYEPAVEEAATPTTRIVNVPLPGGGASSVGAAPTPNASASAPAPAINPLLAPLRGAVNQRAASADDMPLPPKAAAVTRDPAPAPKVDSKPTVAPIPLPN